MPFDAAPPCTLLTAQVERWADCVDDLAVLFPAHYEALALNKDKVPLAPRWDAYAGMERQGILLLVTLRQAGALKGYFVGMVQPSLHYGNCLECSMDMFWTDPAIRGGRGLLTPGLLLFRAVRRELKRRGVQRWHVGSKMHQDASRLFRALGMTPIETYYSQWIGG